MTHSYPPLLVKPDPLALYGRGGELLSSIVTPGDLPADYPLELPSPYTILAARLTQDTTITATGWTVGGQLVITAAQDATGGHALTVIAGEITLDLGAPTSDNPTAFGTHVLISPDGQSAGVLSSFLTNFSPATP